MGEGERRGALALRPLRGCETPLGVPSRKGFEELVATSQVMA